MAVWMNNDLCDFMGEFFSLLAHATRIRIFCALQDGPQRVSDLADKAGITLSNASQHLRIMREKGALVTEKKAQNVYYRIADPRFTQAAELIRDALLEKVQGQARRMAHEAMDHRSPATAMTPADTTTIGEPAGQPRGPILQTVSVLTDKEFYHDDQ